MRLTVKKILEITGGKTIRQSADSFESYIIDSRKAKEGALFFAMKGEHTDGHLFVRSAIEAGAAGAVIEKVPEDIPERGTLILVEDTMRALHDLGAFVRNISHSRFIGITGSSGKTSTKEFTAAILGEKYSVYKSEGNLNSITGLPLSLLAMEEEERAIFEVGMNQKGEIARLASLLKPDVAVLLNVNPVHLGQFSSIDEIAIEKVSLADHLSEPRSTVIYNSDDPLLQKLVTEKPGKHIAFGMNDRAEIRISNLELRGVQGLHMNLVFGRRRHQLHSSLCGPGNAYNIAAAAATALVEGVESEYVEHAVTLLKPYTQRGVLLNLNGLYIYDDSYNSNPKALEYALSIVAGTPDFKRKAAVVGDMLELGPDEIYFHENAGKLAAAHKFEVLITAGPLSKYTAEAALKAGVPHVYPTANSVEAADKAMSILQSGDLVLVKGSRGMKMETVIERLRSR